MVGGSTVIIILRANEFTVLPFRKITTFFLKIRNGLLVRPSDVAGMESSFLNFSIYGRERGFSL